MTDTPKFEVGYRRPPTANQFRKGQSGNPSGRPKGSKSISAVIASALAERVTVNKNGKRCLISKLEAAAIQLANKAAAGDRHAAKLIIDLLHQAEGRDEARIENTPLGAEQRREQDAAILAALRAAAHNLIPETGDAQLS